MFPDINLLDMTDTKPERPGNHGAELLSLAIKARGVSANEAGKIVSAPTGGMSRLLAGKRKPGRKLAASIESALGVPVESWDQDLPDAEEDDSEIPAVTIEKAG